MLFFFIFVVFFIVFFVVNIICCIGIPFVQAYQATLHLHGRYKVVNDKGVALRKAGDALKAENTKLAKEKEAMERQKMALEEELKKMVDRHQSEMKKAQEEHDKIVEKLRNRATLIGAEAVCKTRVLLFKEYWSGAHADWDSKEMQDEIDDYEEMERLKLEESLAEQGVVDEVGDGGVDKSPENENLNADGQNAVAASVESISQDARTDALA